MKQTRILLTAITLLVGLLIAPIENVRAQTDPPVVRAVLFYSPGCGHCTYVITEVLPPLMEEYGNQLEIFGVDVTQPDSQPLIDAALQKFGLEQTGVPFLVVDNIYLVGSEDIPEKFPGLIEKYLGEGGVDWPDIPGLREAITASSPPDEAVSTPSTMVQIPPVDSPSSVSTIDHKIPAWRENFQRDLAANILAVIVLIGMLASIVWAYVLFRRANGLSHGRGWGWVIPALCVLGLGVSGYLAYVEATDISAVCGPVGDCNTVQQSEYARLFGILSIGVMGLFGYIAIFAAWLVARYVKGRLADLGAVSLLGMTVFGTLFSIYLTFLEPFVIGATCAWCLTSAVLVTALMILSVEPAGQAFSKPRIQPSTRHSNRKARKAR